MYFQLIIGMLCTGATLGASTTNVTEPTSLFFPTYLEYGGTGKLYSDIKWGTNATQKVIKTVMDLGSASFWVFGPGAEISYGDSQINFGSCLQTVDPVYEWNASHTAVLSTSQFSGTYSYGGNSKEIVAHYTVNDTVSFPSNQNAPSLANINVAVSNSPHKVRSLLIVRD